jgi:hypothetical protein
MSVRRWRQESTPRSARNSRALRELRERTPHIPMIIDAGIGQVPLQTSFHLG